MINIFLIVLLVAIPILAVFFSCIFVALFSTPTERFSSPIPKIVVMFSMALAICSIFVLPFDVWNTTQYGGLDAALPIIWQVLFAIIIVLVLIVMPFTFFYYESYDPDIEGPRGVLFQSIWGFVSALITFVIVGAIAGLSYIGLNSAEIPVVLYATSAYKSSLAAALDIPSVNAGFYKGETLTIQMSFIVYFTGILSIGGWLAFVICGGCGMSALPLNCILMFCKKPPRIDKDEFERQQKLYAIRADKLISIGLKLDDKRKNRVERLKPKNIRQFREFKEAVKDLEDDWKFIYTAYADAGGSIFPYIGALLVGIFFAIVTLLWIIHIIIYMIPPFPLWGFLNLFFVWFDFIFPLFGLILYSVFALYLLLCVLYGNIAVASRLPLVSVFPLKWKDTLLNSFIFNTGLMLLVSITIVQFCLNAFSMYSRSTSIDSFFNLYIGYMRGLGYFFRYIHYVLFLFILIGIVASIVNSIIPTDKQKRIKMLLADTQ